MGGIEHYQTGTQSHLSVTHLTFLLTLSIMIFLVNFKPLINQIYSLLLQITSKDYLFNTGQSHLNNQSLASVES